MSCTGRALTSTDSPAQADRAIPDTPSPSGHFLAGDRKNNEAAKAHRHSLPRCARVATGPPPVSAEALPSLGIGKMVKAAPT